VGKLNPPDGGIFLYNQVDSSRLKAEGSKFEWLGGREDGRLGSSKAFEFPGFLASQLYSLPASCYQL